MTTQRISMKGARVHVLEMSPVEQGIEGLPSRPEIARAVGVAEYSISQIVRHGMMRAQLHIVTKCVAAALPGWTDEGLAEVVAFAIEHRLGAALVCGDLTIDELLDLLDESEAA